jgi:hypothetical protein
MTAAATRPIESGPLDALALTSSLTGALVSSDLVLVLFGIVAVATLVTIAAVILCDGIE